MSDRQASTNVHQLATTRKRANALDRIQDELGALRPDDLLNVNVNVHDAVAIIRGALARVQPLRPRMAKELPLFDQGAFERLSDYVTVLTIAQERCSAAVIAQPKVRALQTRAAGQRQRLLNVVKALTACGLLSDKPLKKLQGAQRSKKIAHDLRALADLLRVNETKLRGKTPLTEQELAEADAVAAELPAVVTAREQPNRELIAAMDQRDRAYTLAFRTYQDLRLAVAYLRGRAEDGDTVTPRIHGGRPRRRTAKTKGQREAQA